MTWNPVGVAGAPAPPLDAPAVLAPLEPAPELPEPPVALVEPLLDPADEPALLVEADGLDAPPLVPELAVDAEPDAPTPGVGPQPNSTAAARASVKPEARVEPYAVNMCDLLVIIHCLWARD